MSEVNKISITVARVAFWTVGVRLWFVVQATDGTRYQRWSLDMNSTDECLMLTQAGDVLNIGYVGEEFDAQGILQKNIIHSAAFQ
jgi:hypothetical protein